MMKAFLLFICRMAVPVVLLLPAAVHPHSGFWSKDLARIAVAALAIANIIVAIYMLIRDIRRLKKSASRSCPEVKA